MTLFGEDLLDLKNTAKRERQEELESKREERYKEIKEFLIRMAKKGKDSCTMDLDSLAWVDKRSYNYIHDDYEYFQMALGADGIRLSMPDEYATNEFPVYELSWKDPTKNRNEAIQSRTNKVVDDMILNPNKIR